jgi:hypothetical protein
LKGFLKKKEWGGSQNGAKGRGPPFFFWGLKNLFFWGAGGGKKKIFFFFCLKKIFPPKPKGVENFYGVGRGEKTMGEKKPPIFLGKNPLCCYEFPQKV